VDARDYCLAEKLHKAKTEHQRLQVCLDAIDHGVIHKGMNVKDLDLLLGTTYTKEIPAKETDQKVASYSLGERPFTWRLVFYLNGRGDVLGYYLTNLSWKGWSSFEPAILSSEKMAARFRNATPSQRLDCAIEAIDGRLISKLSPRTSLNAIFGKCTEEEEIGPGLILTSFVFGSAKNSWRLMCCGGKDHIYNYYLTNFHFETPCDFSGDKAPSTKP